MLALVLRFEWPIDGPEPRLGHRQRVFFGWQKQVPPLAQEAFLGGDDGGSGFGLERGKCGDGLEDGYVVGSGVV